jgi:hypothetical protein
VRPSHSRHRRRHRFRHSGRTRESRLDRCGCSHKAMTVPVTVEARFSLQVFQPIMIIHFDRYLTST